MKLKGLYLSRAGMERLNIKRRKGSQAVLLKVLLRKTGYRQDQAEDYLPEGLPEEITDKEREQLKRLYWLARMIRQTERGNFKNRSHMLILLQEIMTCMTLYTSRRKKW